VMFISGYFTNQVMSGLHLMYVGKVFVVSSVWCSMLNILYLRLVCLSGLTFSKGQQGSLEETMSVGFTPSFGLRQQVVPEGV